MACTVTRRTLCSLTCINEIGQTGNAKTFLDLGSFISAVIYFVIFMAVIYFVIVMPYKHIQARRGQVVFGDPAKAAALPLPADWRPQSIH